MYTTGSPDADKAIAETGAKLIQDALSGIWKHVRKTPDWLKAKYALSDPFGVEAAKYSELVNRIHGTTRVLGLATPIFLRDIYVKLLVTDKIPSRQTVPLYDLEVVSQLAPTEPHQGVNAEDGGAVFDRSNRLAVLGPPGGGKTTFLKWLAIASLGNKLATQSVPVFVSLKEWTETDDTILKFCSNIFQVCEIDEPDAVLLKLLEGGNGTLLIDGLDEVSGEKWKNPESRNNSKAQKELCEDLARKEIKELSIRFPKSKIVVTCRTAAYRYIFEDFVEVELASFEFHQIEQFIKNWFSTRSSVAEACISELSSTRNRAIRELCATPLLLTLMCLAFESELTFPPNRAELFRSALDALLRKWDSSRAIRRESEYEGLSIQKKELLFSYIADNTFPSGDYFIKKIKLTTLVDRFMTSWWTPERKDQKEVEPNEVITEIEIQHGIIRERALGIYSFSHLTFQEYYMAQAVSANTNPNGPFQLLDQHLEDHRWREVILLTAAMLAQADSFIERMRFNTSGIVSDTDSTQALRIAREASDYIHSAPVYLRRATAIRNAALVSAKTSENDFTSLLDAAEDLVAAMRNEAIKQAKLSRHSVQVEPEISVDGHRKITELSKKITESPIHLRRSLESYARASTLLLGCLNVDAAVSRGTRKRIVESLLAE